MKQADKIARVKALLDNDAQATDELVAIYLSDAEQTILNRMYPFGIPDDSYIPERYESIQCQLAQRYFLRRGAEGEVIHNENGVNRTYQSVNDEDILRTIIQKAKAVI